MGVSFRTILQRHTSCVGLIGAVLLLSARPIDAAVLSLDPAVSEDDIGVLLDESEPDRTPVGLDCPALYAFAGQRLAATHQGLPAGTMPTNTDSYGATWNTGRAGEWTSGFFAGQLWMLYRETGDEAWLSAAKTRTSDIIGQEYNGTDHDVGFRVLSSFGQGVKSLPDSDPDQAAYRSRLLQGAETLALRYRPAYQAIEAFTGDTVIIDGMMNLELLFWTAESGSPNATQLYDIGVHHALTTMNEHVRADGSTYHVVQFDPISGDVMSKSTRQGYADESTWSRGQAWGIYGFTTTYRYTGDHRFLDTAVALADYWLDHLPPSGIAPYDFAAPGEPPLDSSATAIAASALLELMRYVGPQDGQQYFDAAQDMLEALAGPETLTSGLDYDCILREGSIAWYAFHMGLVYGDYYFLEALQRYSAASALAGDYNGDGTVDAADYTAWRDSLGRTGFGLAADGDGSGIVGQGDYTTWKASFGKTSGAAAVDPQGATVPEPSALVLGLVALVCLAARTRPRG